MKNQIIFSLLFSFLLTHVKAQDTTGFGQVQRIIKDYDFALQVTGDPNAKPEDIKAIPGKFKQDFVSLRCHVYNDLDSNDADTNYLRLGSYMKKLSQYEWGVESGINHKKVRIQPFSINESRNRYGTTADVLKFINITHITEREIDTAFIDTACTPSDSVVCDTIKTKLVIRDTIIEKKLVKLTFYISAKKEDDNTFSNVQVYAISKFKGTPKFLPLDKWTRYWTSLSPGWKKAFNDELSLGEIPSRYRLGFIEGIEKINLQDKGITDLSPLQATKALKYLNCEGLPISDLSPIENLSNLRELNLNGTQVDTLLHLAKLTKLEKLEARGLGIRSIAYLSEMTEMIELDLAENQIDSVDALKKMTKLEKLDLSLNKITDISFMQNITTVTELKIRKNEIKTLEPLRYSGNLVVLDCYNTDITTLEPLSGLKKLTTLDCSHTKITSLTPIKNNLYMTHLYVAHTKATNFEVIGKFFYLRELDVSTTQINSIEPIQKMKYITLFRAIDTEISKNEIQRFKKQHPKCKIWYY